METKLRVGECVIDVGERPLKFACWEAVNELINPEIENKFSYHPPKAGQPEKYEAIRDKAKELAYLIEKECPNSGEKSLSITQLEQTVMWANASIARYE